MKKGVIILIALLLGVCAELSAQHSLGVMGGYGSGSMRPYPSEQSRTVWGLYSGGLTWRYYTEDRYWGGVGVDLEFLQRAYSFAPYTVTNNNDGDNYGKELLYYTRNINSIMVPLVWQPHVYMFNKRLRVYIEAAATFSYNINSTYEDELEQSYGTEDWQGDYEFKLARDNRWNYGLAGGVGLSYIRDRLEFNARARYYFGYSDILKNRNKYYSNNNDGTENPFTYTPTRSPIDNVNISFGVSYRLSKGGYKVWTAPKSERAKAGDGFQYEGAEANSSNRDNSGRSGARNSSITNR